jgi:hypothetical protein
MPKFLPIPARFSPSLGRAPWPNPKIRLSIAVFGQNTLPIQSLRSIYAAPRPVPVFKPRSFTAEPAETAENECREQLTNDFSYFADALFAPAACGQNSLDSSAFSATSSECTHWRAVNPLLFGLGAAIQFLDLTQPFGLYPSSKNLYSLAPAGTSGGLRKDSSLHVRR